MAYALYAVHWEHLQIEIVLCENVIKITFIFKNCNGLNTARDLSRIWKSTLFVYFALKTI